MTIETIDLRPHHFPWLAGAIYYFRKLGNLDYNWAYLFAAREDELKSLLKSLGKRKETGIVLTDGPDIICRVCRNYDSKNNVCAGYYGDEDKNIPAEELRKKVDRKALEFYDGIDKVKSIDDILVNYFGTTGEKEDYFGDKKWH